MMTTIAAPQLPTTPGRGSNLAQGALENSLLLARKTHNLQLQQTRSSGDAGVGVKARTRHIIL